MQNKHIRYAIFNASKDERVTEWSDDLGQVLNNGRRKEYIQLANGFEIRHQRTDITDDPVLNTDPIPLTQESADDRYGATISAFISEMEIAIAGHQDAIKTLEHNRDAFIHALEKFPHD